MSSIIPLTIPTIPVVNSSQSSITGHNNTDQMIHSPLDHYRLRLYNYAMVERIRSNQYAAAIATNSGRYIGHHHLNHQQHLQTAGVGGGGGGGNSGEQINSRVNHNEQNLTHNNIGTTGQTMQYDGATVAAAAAAANQSRFALSMQFLHNRVFQPEEPKPQHSYIGLIAMAILNSPETKLVLSDIYQHILDNYPYFRTRGPGWRNSIRHNLSLNDCFIKAGRSVNGKGHYWAIHPANLEDFKKGDFRRRKAQRKVRKHMGLAVDDEGTDSQSPPPLCTTPPQGFQAVAAAVAGLSPFTAKSWAALAAVHGSAIFPIPLPQQPIIRLNQTTNLDDRVTIIKTSASRKRQFDVASLLEPDDQHLIKLNETNIHNYNNNNNNNIGRNYTFNDSLNSLQNFNKIHQQQQANIIDNNLHNLHNSNNHSLSLSSSSLSSYQYNPIFGITNYQYGLKRTAATIPSSATTFNSDYFINNLQNSPNNQNNNDDNNNNNNNNDDNNNDDNNNNNTNNNNNNNSNNNSNNDDDVVDVVANDIPIQDNSDEDNYKNYNSDDSNNSNLSNKINNAKEQPKFNNIINEISNFNENCKKNNNNNNNNDNDNDNDSNIDSKIGQLDFGICKNDRYHKLTNKFDNKTFNYQNIDTKLWKNQIICSNNDETGFIDTDSRQIDSYYDKYLSTTLSIQQRRQKNDDK